MFFTVAGPRLQSADMPWDSLLIRLGSLALLFGPFGLAAGTGVGLLLDGLLNSRGSRGMPPGEAYNPLDCKKAAPKQSAPPNR